jgi:hypothetical protein
VNPGFFGASQVLSVRTRKAGDPFPVEKEIPDLADRIYIYRRV